LGVCAPEALRTSELHELLLKKQSGIRHHQELSDLGFSCQIGGMPNLEQVVLEDYFDRAWLKGLNSKGLIYAALSGKEAWLDAGLPIDKEGRDADTGIVFGAGILGIDKLREAIHKVDQGEVRRLGSTTVLQTMTSGASAYLAGMFGCGNRVSANSSACSTGTEAIALGYDWIRQGKAKRMLVGSTSEGGPYVWGGFDAMRILPRKFNDRPTEASRPMSASASGFVPSCGAGALVLEEMESAKARGAGIYAEIEAAAVNGGGQREGGSFTAPNPLAVRDCINEVIEKSGVHPQGIDVINGHLTATAGDLSEIKAWYDVFHKSRTTLPFINSFKGHLGHALAAAGSIESVGCVLQLKHQVIYGNRNLSDLHPQIAELASSDLQQESQSVPLRRVIKASFGFGDVNACLIFRQWSD
jgi:3-oxoacyl-(acyl-carrier-protein) synthase